MRCLAVVRSTLPLNGAGAYNAPLQQNHQAPPQLMNFLAHLLLSGPPSAPHYTDIVVGNFAAEAVRGRAAVAAYPPAVQQGIRLHRFIDSFTDQHPAVRRTTARLRQAGLGKWAGVAADVGYDHLLARDFGLYHPPETLPAFAQRHYELLHQRRHELPARLQHLLAYMRRDDWLSGYARPEGLHRALLGLSRRVPAAEVLATGAAAFLAELPAYEEDFWEFWPELRAAVAQTHFTN
ncbi:acyl carrier protein phosphodiesterase [Hymenobacter weizhouensis]|uniref:acyl carrier protein phosphodiesterase n=1 Tax=Hymenobacter sp. YIM 151500-1 TaxID=2987689 RepID=UPI002225E099|nr:acyl carrier protein phosphodiesterase [Hymenobacter sp. YIM 151500-1]UYZ63989.1 acyl carrier protein phosphodiesterase [Hymenobacter sp. YIM 151500-1]